MHRITNILQVVPYKILCEFDGKENREIDFSPLIDKQENTFISKLKDKNIFLQVKLDPISKTIYWENLALVKDYDGTVKPCELDFDATELYRKSKLYIS